METVTNYKRTDGFGAQFQSVLWTMIWANLTGKIFVYSDIDHIDLISNSGTVADTEVENTLEETIDYMGLKKYCIPYDAGMHADVPRITHNVPYEFIQKDMTRSFNSGIFLEFKAFFLQDKVNRFKNDRTNVAVHIRRLGNFERENNRFRPGTHDTPNSYYLDTMNLIRNRYSDKNLLFHVYSQGSETDFQELAGSDTIFHLNEKVLNTFTDLIFADILVTCRSSFSYLAALFSNNDIYYLPFWHPPLSHWNIISETY